MDVQPKWTRVSRAAVQRSVTKGKLFLGVSGDKVFAGRVDEITDRYLVLQNGDNRQTVYYDQRLIRFQTFEPPEGFDLSMGNSEFQFSMDSSGSA
jgi:hypothetical protein